MKYSYIDITVFCPSCDAKYTIKRGEPVYSIDSVLKCIVCGEKTELDLEKDVEWYFSKYKIDDREYNLSELQKKRRRLIKQGKRRNQYEYYKIKNKLSYRDREYWNGLSLEEKREIRRGVDSEKGLEKLENMIDFYQEMNNYLRYVLVDVSPEKTRKYVYNQNNLDRVSVWEDDQERTVIELGEPSTRD